MNPLSLVLQSVLFLSLQQRVPVGADASALSLAHWISRTSEGQEGMARTPKKLDAFSLGAEVSAKSAVAIDTASGAVLFEKAADIPRSIGSITKLMTALVFLESAPPFEGDAGILPSDVRYGGIQYILPGDTIRVQDVFAASLIGSDNSSSAALARLSGLSTEAFVARMNTLAKELGMEHTHFVDTTGLSSANRSTALDVSKLLLSATKNERLRPIIQKPEAVFVGASGHTYKIPSTDELLGTYIHTAPYAVIGAKTGYLPEAGYCLAARITKEQSGDVLVVVLGSTAKSLRFDDVKSLASWAFETFSWETSL